MGKYVKNLTLKLKSKLTFKRVVVALVVAMTVLLPSTFAIITVIQSQFNFEDSAKIHTVSLYDKNSRLLFFENMTADTEDENSLVDIFTNIHESLEPISASDVEPLEIEPLIVELKSDVKTEKLKCFFSMTGEGAYCTGSDGRYYSIEDNDNELFLGSKFAETLYSVASPPSLTTADGDTVLLCDTSWYYKNRDGIDLLAEKIEKANTGIPYIFSESISLSFTSAPDSVFVEVFDGDERLECTLDELENLPLNNHSGIRILISAQWEDHGEREFRGTATYDFTAEIHNRSEFFLSTDKLSVGEFAFVRITEVSEASKLSFKSDDSSFYLKFIISGNEAYAVLPWSLLEGKESVDFTLNYGASSRSFTLSAAEPFLYTSKEFMTVSEDIGLTPSAINSAPLKYVFFTSATYSQNPEVFEKVLGFGESDPEGDGTPSFCDTYVCKDTRGASVGALMGGRVIAVGTLSGSKFVAIDSGLGIRTWYLYLSSADVSVGDTVSAGDVIGKTGAFPNNEQDGFCVAVSYNDTFIDPDFIIK
ncbi:MAG: M23 family metallopeptidase [Ruminococcaceae bacterium]|nr:M23 family metallopeptidase [Oscillospiraceae bacterium]